MLLLQDQFYSHFGDEASVQKILELRTLRVPEKPQKKAEKKKTKSRKYEITRRTFEKHARRFHEKFPGKFSKIRGGFTVKLKFN